MSNKVHSCLLIEKYIDYVTCKDIPLDACYKILRSPNLLYYDVFHYWWLWKYQFIKDEKESMINADKRHDPISLVIIHTLRDCSMPTKKMYWYERNGWEPWAAKIPNIGLKPKSQSHHQGAFEKNGILSRSEGDASKKSVRSSWIRILVPIT